MIRFILIFSLIAVPAGFAFSAEENHVISFVVHRISVYPGQKTTVTVTISVKTGYHVQANPPSDPFLVPIELSLETPSGWKAGKPQYPPGHPFKIKGTDTVLSVLEGTFNINIDLEIPPWQKPGKMKLRGKIRYQACTSKTCLIPRTIDFEYPVRVKKQT